MKLEDKHFNHLAKMQALTDNSWSSWESPIGLTIFFIGSVLALNGLALFAFLVKTVIFK